MSNALRLFVAVFLCVRCVPAQSPAPDSGAKPVVLQKNEGDPRTRRPREGVASPSNRRRDHIAGYPLIRELAHRCPDRSYL